MFFCNLAHNSTFDTIKIYLLAEVSFSAVMSCFIGIFNEALANNFEDLFQNYDACISLNLICMNFSGRPSFSFESIVNKYPFNSPVSRVVSVNV